MHSLKVCTVGCSLNKQAIHGCLFFNENVNYGICAEQARKFKSADETLQVKKVFHDK